MHRKWEELVIVHVQLHGVKSLSSKLKVLLSFHAQSCVRACVRACVCEWLVWDNRVVWL